MMFSNCKVKIGYTNQFRIYNQDEYLVFNDGPTLQGLENNLWNYSRQLSGGFLWIVVPSNFCREGVNPVSCLF